MKFIRLRSFHFLAAGIFLTLASQVFAQDAVAPPDGPVLSQNEIQALQSSTPVPNPSTSAPGRNVEVTTGRPEAEIPRRLQYSFSVTARGVYDDNINISSSDSSEDYYFAIEPSLFIGLGSGDTSSLGLTYRPSLFLFVDHSENDGLQHVIHLQANHSFGHLSMTLAGDVQVLDGQNLNSFSDPTGHQANIDVGARTEHQIYTGSVGASYDLTGKLFLTVAGALAADEYETLISSRSFSGNMYLNYKYSDKLVVGVGGTGGYNTTDNSFSDQNYEQANVRATYSATGKISFGATFGIEFRQAENKSGTAISPVFDLSASYQPFDGTAISITGSRRTQNSAVLAGQDFAETTVSASLSQRFMQRFTLGLAVGYTNSDYFSVIDGLPATRTDNYYYIEPSVDASVTRYWTVGVYYLHREDSSSAIGFEFEDNQAGFRSTITF